MSVDSDSARQVLELRWEDGSVTTIPWQALRLACPCAACRGEFGETSQALQPADQQTRVSDIVLMGHYAIQPIWADGHSTGIYPWEYLRSLVNRRE